MLRGLSRGGSRALWLPPTTRSSPYRSGAVIQLQTEKVFEITTFLWWTHASFTECLRELQKKTKKDYFSPLIESTRYGFIKSIYLRTTRQKDIETPLYFSLVEYSHDRPHYDRQKPSHRHCDGQVESSGLVQSPETLWSRCSWWPTEKQVKERL